MLFVVFVLIQGSVFAQQIPSMISYQGKVLDNGVPYNGTGNFMFEIYSSGSKAPYWSNDGNYPPSTNVAIQVNNGLFSVNLGDDTLMLPLPADLFNVADLYLGIWFNGVRLSPDQALVSSGYSFRSLVCDDAESVDGYSYSSIWPTTLANIQNACSDDFHTIGGEDDDVPDTDAEVPDAISINNSVLYAVEGGTNVGIGTTSPSAKLTVNGGILRYGSTMYGTNAATHINLGTSSTTGLSGQNYSYAIISGGYSNTASNNYTTISGGYSQIASGYGATIGGGYNNEVSSDYGNVSGGRDNTASGSYATVSGGRSNTTASAYASIGGGYNNSVTGLSSTVSGGDSNAVAGDYSWAGGRNMQLSSAADRTFAWGCSGTAVTVDTADSFLIYSGNVGVGTLTPGAKFHVEQPTALDAFRVSLAGTTQFIVDENGRTGVGTNAPLAALHVQEDSTDDLFRVRNNSTTHFIITNDGNIGAGTLTPGDHQLYVASGVGGASGASLFVTNTNTTNGIALSADNDSDDVTILASQHGTGDILRLDSYQGGWHPVFVVEESGRTGVKTSTPTYDLDVAGTIRATVSYICPSKDLAEKLPVHPDFQLTEAELEQKLDLMSLSDESKERVRAYQEMSKIGPGTVVIITSEGMIPCSIENDTRLAGIISTEPAVKMGNEVKGQYVALAGSVPCYVTGQIKAGDLLTTSSVPGHAQRADEVVPGSIVGKALEDFDGESGLIRVWIGGF